VFWVPRSERRLDGRHALPICSPRLTLALARLVAQERPPAALAGNAADELLPREAIVLGDRLSGGAPPRALSRFIVGACFPGSSWIDIRSWASSSLGIVRVHLCDDESGSLRKVHRAGNPRNDSVIAALVNDGGRGTVWT
jgi:hypothetical protein